MSRDDRIDARRFELRPRRRSGHKRKKGARGVYIRDRSTEPGCRGCIRIGAGIVAHTRRCIEVMEEVLCAAP